MQKKYSKSWSLTQNRETTAAASQHRSYGIILMVMQIMLLTKHNVMHARLARLSPKLKKLDRLTLGVIGGILHEFHLNRTLNAHNPGYNIR